MEVSSIASCSMDALEAEIHQVFVKLLDGKHRILNFNAPSISVSSLKHRLQTLTSIPSRFQLLLNNSRILDDHQTLILVQSLPNPQFTQTSIPNSSTKSDRDTNRSRFADQNGFRKFPVVVQLSLRLRGGKGGFGSLLRGAATKAGQKKTNNFDACRDMSGRRLRHVNAEKKLEEWRAEAEERKLEKMAEDFLKKKAKEVKKSGKGNGGDGTEKYVAKYREDSDKCREEVERSVRESVKGLMYQKRKSQAEGNDSPPKRFKIWMGKRKLGDSDSEEDLDEGDADVEEEENEGSVIIDNGSNSDSSKELDASSGSIAGGELGAGSVDQGSDEENTEEPVKSLKDQDKCGEDAYSKNKEDLEIEGHDQSKEAVVSEVHSKCHSNEVNDVISRQPGTSDSEVEVVSAAEARDSSASESVSVNAGESPQDMDKPLNLDDYHSAAELEVLGLERLKSELQARGLKCGGTLQERAARLFLLKTTPLDMLPKKLFAKK